MTKIDLKAAYRRVHLQATMALQACVLIGGLLLLALRLTFGGAANPSMWSDISELLMDLANDIVHHPGWDPSRHSSPPPTSHCRPRRHGAGLCPIRLRPACLRPLVTHFRP
jgi:hypothetical protein